MESDLEQKSQRASPGTHPRQEEDGRVRVEAGRVVQQDDARQVRQAGRHRTPRAHRRQPADRGAQAAPQRERIRARARHAGLACKLTKNKKNKIKMHFGNYMRCCSFE